MPGFFLGGGAVQQGFYPVPGPDFFWGGGGLVRKDLTMYHGRIPSLPSSRIAAKGPGRRPQPKSQGHISSGFYKQIQHRAPRSPSGILCSVLWHTSYVVDGKNLGEVGFPPVPLPPFLPRGGGYEPKNMPDSTSHLPSGSHKKALGENSTSIILRAWAESIRKSVGIHLCSQVLDFPATCLGFSNILPNELVMGFEEQLQADSRREEKREERGE